MNHAERKELRDKHQEQDGLCSYCYCDLELSMGRVKFPCDAIMLVNLMDSPKPSGPEINWAGGK